MREMVKVIAAKPCVFDEHYLDEVGKLRKLPVGEVRDQPRSPTTHKRLQSGDLLPGDAKCAAWGCRGFEKDALAAAKRLTSTAASDAEKGSDK